MVVMSLLLLALICLLIVIKGIKKVPKTQAYVIERFGKYNRVIKEGKHFVFPVIEKVVKVVSLTEQNIEFSEREYSLLNDRKVLLQTFIFLKIKDVKNFCYKSERPISAIEDKADRILSTEIEKITFDQLFDYKSEIENKVLKDVKEESQEYGIDITVLKILIKK